MNSDDQSVVVRRFGPFRKVCLNCPYCNKGFGAWFGFIAIPRSLLHTIVCEDENNE